MTTNNNTENYFTTESVELPFNRPIGNDATENTDQDKTLISPFLDDLLKRYVRAGLGKKISALVREEALRKLSMIILEAYSSKSMKPSGYNAQTRKESLMVMSKMVYADLITEFQNFTMDEVQLAIKNGLKHAYGHYDGINAVTILQFLKKFRADEDRQEAFRKQRQYLNQLEEEKSTSKLSDMDEDELGRRTLCSCFESYQKCGRFIDACQFGYDYAIRAKLFFVTRKEKLIFYQRAVQEVNAELVTNRKHYHDKYSRPTEEQVEQMYKERAKEITLRQFFRVNQLSKEGKLDMSTYNWEGWIDL